MGIRVHSKARHCRWQLPYQTGVKWTSIKEWLTENSAEKEKVNENFYDKDSDLISVEDGVVQYCLWYSYQLVRNLSLKTF